MVWELVGFILFICMGIYFMLLKWDMVYLMKSMVFLWNKIEILIVVEGKNEVMIIVFVKMLFGGINFGLMVIY